MSSSFRIPRPLRNKYFVAGLAFLLWLLFFDKDDLFVQRERRSQLEQIQDRKHYYEKEIATEKKFAEDLKNNPATIEQFAREAYGMKRENEDLFVVEPATAEK
jgi:cell division protein DivIC